MNVTLDELARGLIIGGFVLVVLTAAALTGAAAAWWGLGVLAAGATLSLYAATHDLLAYLAQRRINERIPNDV